MRFSALFFLSFSLLAQTPTISQVFVSKTVPRSSQIISWSTDIRSGSEIHWAYSAAPLNGCNFSTAGKGSNVGCFINRVAQDAPVYIHTWFTGPTTANTAVYYQVCSYGGAYPATLGCSPTSTYTSAAQAVIPANPIPPKPVDAPVVPTGTVRTVGARSHNCNDPNDGLVAQWKASARGDVVEIDPALTPLCASFDPYVFPAKASGAPYILTRVKNADALFPGNRRANPKDKPHMARFIDNAPNTILNGAADPTRSSCFAGNLLWRQDQANTWQMYRCRNVDAQPITAIPASGTLNLTIASTAGFIDGNMGWVTGVSGPGAGAVNGGWVLHVVNGTTVQLQNFIGRGTPPATGAASGGTVYLNRYQLEPVTEGPGDPPATCKFGEWYHKKAGSGKEDQYHRTWYCDNPNEWIPFRFDPGNSGSPAPSIDINTHGVDHVMFKGISIEGMNLAAVNMNGYPLLLEYSYVNSSLQSGSMYGQMLPGGSDHVYWDDIVAGCPDPSATGSIMRCQQFMHMDGSHIHLGSSYLFGFQNFAPLQSLSDDAAQTIGSAFGGPMEITNNYIECAGICTHFYDDLASTTAESDLTVTHNTYNRPDKYWDPKGPLLKQGFYFSDRHALEFKRMHRALIAGNRFEGGWVWNNSGAQLCLCTRGGGIGGYAIIDGANITAAPGWPLIDVKQGDLMAFGALEPGCAKGNINRIFTVASVKDANHITLSPSTGCKSTILTSNLMGRVNADTNNISDILVRDNTYLNSPTDVVSLGHDSYSGIGSGHGMASTVARRFKFINNLSIGLNSGRVGRGQYYAAPAVANSGGHFELSLGYEDLQVIHETVVSRDPTTMNFHFGYDMGTGSSGLVFVNNIGSIQVNRAFLGGSGNVFGKAALDDVWIAANPPYIYGLNIIMKEGGNGPPFDTASPPYGPYPPGTIWFDGTYKNFPFANAAAGNYRLKSKSPFSHDGKNHAVIERDIGADIDELEAAQGKVSNVRASAEGVDFFAPDNYGCPVDWSTDDFSTYTRTNNNGGARTQHVALSGLPAHSKISYRIECIVEQPEGTFTTR